MGSWLCAHVHAFEHFGGIPALTVPDNTKTGVSKAHRYDPDLNPIYYMHPVLRVLSFLRRDNSEQ
jgi:transposase